MWHLSDVGHRSLIMDNRAHLKMFPSRRKRPGLVFSHQSGQHQALIIGALHPILQVPLHSMGCLAKTMLNLQLRQSGTSLPASLNRLGRARSYGYARPATAPAARTRGDYAENHLFINHCISSGGSTGLRIFTGDQGIDDRRNDRLHLPTERSSGHLYRYKRYIAA